MADAKRALVHFLELADKGPTLRAALVEEIDALFANWPANYPSELRTVLTALREKAARELAPPAPRREAMPLFLRREIDTSQSDRVLVPAARTGTDFPHVFARLIGISPRRAEGIFADRSADALATACKGAHLGRPAFSALAILAGEGRLAGDRMERLAAYDAVSEANAERTLNAWRVMDRFAHAAE